MLRRAPSVGSSGYQRWWGGEAGACTESLGSESGDLGCDAAEIDRFFPPPAPPPAAAAAPAGGAPDDAAALCGAEKEAGAENRLEAAPTTEKRRRGGGGFPPPMPRATGPLFLRAERRGGRLILTEVRAHDRGRRVVFRAERDAGRLRLRFANDDDDDADADAATDGGGVPEAAGGGAGSGAGGVVAVAVQHGSGGGSGGGELCQVAAGNAAARRGVEVGAVMMGTTI